jgi:succinate dehydrogenase/fumarate reductase flavoprotein subunit
MADNWGSEWEEVADVVVVGSGAAGFGAAFAAAAAGASVIVLEKASFVGGTTARSGGVMWVCDNPVMRSQGIDDDRAAALRYLARTAYPTQYNPRHDTLGLPDNRFKVLEAFYDKGSEALEEAIAAGMMELEAVPYPDYYAHLPEDEAPWGRCIQAKYPPGHRPGLDPTGGQFLVDRLREGAEKLGTRTILDAEVVHLVRNSSGDVVGVEVRIGRRTALIGARKGVVFGSGGFLHNPEYTREFLRGPLLGGAAAEQATGDFIRIGIEAGAQLGNLSHAWWAQGVLDLLARNRVTSTDVYSPYGDSMIQVNKHGRRVVNEKSPYNERGQVHGAWDSVRGEYPNLLMFMLFDDGVLLNPEPSRFRFPVPPIGQTADYVVSAPTWEALADKLREKLRGFEHLTGGTTLDDAWVANVRGTIARWNEMSQAGVDADFKRGESPIEQTWAGSARNGMRNPTMHPFTESGPYHCVILAPAGLDTKGGPVTDEHARVLDTMGEAIPGLYGAGNCVASPAGQAYWGPGGTVGVAFIFGFIAGKHAATQGVRRPD